MNRSTTLVMVAIAVAVLATPVPVVGSPAATDGPSTVLAAFQSDIDPDGVLIEVTLTPDGSARFAIEYRISLDSDNRSEAFEDLRADIRSDPAPYKARFRSVVTPAVRQAENTTNREMELRNLTVTAERRLAGDTGFVTYTGEWINFAARSDGTIRAGDAIAGLYLDERSSLLIGWPAEYRLVEVTPAADETRERAVLWHGPTTFASTEPRLAVRPVTTGLDLPVVALTGVGIGVLAAVGAVVFVIGHSRRTPAESGPDPTLLSNEERVLDALDLGGGRLRQQELANSLDWTAPKTSRVVNTLRDDGRVEVFRLGRENVVSLPEYDDDT